MFWNSRRPILTRFTVWPVFLPVVLLAIMALLSPGSAQAAGQVGDPAADFNLQDTWGNGHHFEELRQGKVVLLNMIGYG